MTGYAAATGSVHAEDGYPIQLRQAASWGVDESKLPEFLKMCMEAATEMDRLYTVCDILETRLNAIRHNWNEAMKSTPIQPAGPVHRHDPDSPFHAIDELLKETDGADSGSEQWTVIYDINETHDVDL